MNLTFLLPNDKSGGGNRVFAELAKKHLTTNKNNSSTIIFFKKSDTPMHYLDAINGVQIIYYETRYNFILFKYVSFFFYLLKYNNYNKLIFSDPFLSLMLIFYPKKKLKNVIRYIQSDDYRMYDDLYILKNKLFLYFYKILCYLSFKVNCLYIFNSIYSFDSFKSINKTFNDEIRIVRPGFDPKIFYSDNLSTKLNLGIIARKHPWKGFEDFKKGYNKLPIDIKNLIDKIYIISHEISNLTEFDHTNIVFINPKNDVEIAMLMRECGIFISTSWFEGYGLPQLESIACGCILLTSDSKGINEFAKNGVNCIMYKSKDFIDLNSKLNEIIFNYRYFKNLFKDVSLSVNKFTWDNTYLEFINNIK